MIQAHHSLNLNPFGNFVYSFPTLSAFAGKQAKPRSAVSVAVCVCATYATYATIQSPHPRPSRLPSRHAGPYTFSPTAGRQYALWPSNLPRRQQNGHSANPLRKNTFCAQTQKPPIFAANPPPALSFRFAILRKSFAQIAQIRLFSRRPSLRLGCPPHVAVSTRPKRWREGVWDGANTPSTSATHCV